MQTNVLIKAINALIEHYQAELGQAYRTRNYYWAQDAGNSLRELRRLKWAVNEGGVEFNLKDYVEDNDFDEVLWDEVVQAYYDRA